MVFPEHTHHRQLHGLAAGLLQAEEAYIGVALLGGDEDLVRALGDIPFPALVNPKPVAQRLQHLPGDGLLRFRVFDAFNHALIPP